MRRAGNDDTDSGVAEPVITESEIRDALTRVLNSSAFAGSQRLPPLLGYIVKSFLAGDLGALKETVVGVEVFDREPGYDPKVDSVVRTEVRRLRERLSDYYRSQGAQDPLVIEVPKGAYVPEFHRQTSPAPVPAAAPQQSVEVAPEQSVGKERRLSAWRQPIWRVALAAVTIAIVLLFVSGGVTDSDTATSASSITRVGVLPFQGPADDPETEVNGGAMANSIVAVLTQIADLDVAYPMTPGWFDSSRPSDAETARELKADYLVTGGFAKGSEFSNAWIRITETRSASVLLARSFDFQWTSLPQVQHEMGEAAAKGISQVLDSRRIHPNSGPKSPDAQRVYLDGYYSFVSFLQSFQTESLHSAERYLLRALELEPGYPDALARLAALKLAAAYPWGKESPADLDEGERFAETALIREPRHVIALTALAKAALFRQQPRVALEHAKRAVEIEPRSPEALNGLADAYKALGLFESAAEVYRRCLREDPVFMEPYIFGALPLVRLGDHEEAVERARGFTRINPTSTHIIGVEAYALIRQGKSPAAEAMLRRSRNSVMARLAADPALAFRLSYLDYPLALAQLRQGRPDFGREVVRKHGAVSPRSLDDLILLTAGLGMSREAIQNLEGSHYYRNYRYLVTEPGLKPLYETPGFQKLLEETYQEWSGMLAEVGDSLPIQPPVLPTPNELLTASVVPAS